MLKKLLSKWVIIGIIILVAVILFSNGFFKKGNGEIKTEKVIRGTLIQEVSETGIIKPTEEIKLGFKISGRISKVNVSVGDIVEKGYELASLDKSSLISQLSQAQASLSVAQEQYNKLAPNAKEAAQQDLNEAYEDALNVLDDSYLKIYNAHNAVASLQSSYFSIGDQEGIKVQNSKATIQNSLNNVKPILDSAKASLNHGDVDLTLSEMKKVLSDTYDALAVVREVCEEGIYYSRVNPTDKTIIDNHKSYIITALTSTTNAEQTVSSDKISLQKTEDDIDYYQSKAKEAEANVSYYQQQIFDAGLRAPISGIITKADKKPGETTQAQEQPFSLISLDPLQVEADIYEEDIVKIKEDNPVDIEIAAFPGKILKGRVVFIDPAEKLISGVVYYGIKISFDKLEDDIKPGMTADVTIKAAHKENVLMISRGAVKKNDKTAVFVYKDNNIEEREIQLGLEGNDNKVEVLSGLSEGEEVVIK